MRTRKDIYLDILHYGLIFIRSSSDLRFNTDVADLLHNLPGLLRNYEDEGLHDYFADVEIPCFLKRQSAGQTLEALFKELATARLRERGAS